MMMRTLDRRRLSGAFLVLFCCVEVAAQIPGFTKQALSKRVAPSQPTAPTSTKDPYGRETPQRTVLNFVKAAQLGDYSTAAKYLQLSTIKESPQSEQIARELLTLINTSLRGSVATISNLPEGSGVDSEDPNLEVVGRFVVKDQEVPLLLARISRKETGPIWLVSSQTLDQLPRLYQALGSPQLDRYFPGLLAATQFLGVPVGQWLTWLLSIPISLAMAWAVVRLLERLWRLRRTGVANAGQSDMVTPLVLMLAIVFNASLVVFSIGMPVFYRVYYLRTLAILLTICGAQLGVKLADRLYQHEKLHSLRRDSRSLLQLLYRVNHVAILIVAALICLSILGFDTKTMLAGLGIGGIALALAAQKTLENLIGGVTLVMDKALSVGDDCVISNRTVTVREIGLRSILATTREGTEITFPNGMLAQANIENLSRQSKYLISATLSVSYESSLAQLQCLVARVREMLYSHDRVVQETAKFRLADLTTSGYQIELFAYVRSANVAEFAAVREDILFRVVEIIGATGAPWAIPAQTTYISKEQLVDEKKVTDADEVVRKWKATNEIPFPDFSPAHIAEVRGTLSYPPDRSVLRRGPTPVQRPSEEGV
jgi:MscS family membrane protein